MTVTDRTATTQAVTALTFLIADVRGWTRFTREHGDTAAARLAQRFADLARDAVAARSGRVIELRGDEALAVFPSSAQAVRAAVELQLTCAEETVADPDLPLLVGIGLDAGPAVAVEGGYRGTSLNLAARLCSTAAAGQVLLTTSLSKTLGEIAGEIDFVSHGTPTLKGFEAPLDVVQAVPLDARPLNRRRNVDAGPIPGELAIVTPLVGREAEGQWLRGTWRQVRRGNGRLLLVSGPAGIGKTRLAAELAEHVAADGGDVLYVGASGAATALTMGAVAAVSSAGRATLLVTDDLDAAAPAAIEAVEAALPRLTGHPVLVLGLLRDPASRPDVAGLVDAANPRGDGHRELPPLNAEEVRAVVSLYARDSLIDAPVESMVRASRGVPGLVHEVASRWARAEAARRLEAAAEFMSAGRDRRSADLDFANNVIGLRLVRLFEDDPGIPTDAPECPYKGLAAFEGADSARFFGRERLVGELAARMVATRALAVVGDSGSGKSSLVAAGLLPSLQAGLLPGSNRWTFTMFRPGSRPLDELRAALDTDGDDPLSSAAAAVGGDGRLVLVVDQFEEVFTLCREDGERQHFLDLLAGDPRATSTSGDLRDRVVVVPVIRSDFYGHLAGHRPLAEQLSSNHVLVGPMSRDELRRVIELPARRAGVRVESALVDALVDEAAGQPGALPLLSTALVELWATRQAGWIRLSTYESGGGVRGAVARLADASFEELSGEEQEAARRVLLRLASGDDPETVTRRRLPLDELDLDGNPVVVRVLDRFTRDRLLTQAQGFVEVAHEALLREWPRLQGWLRDDAQGRVLHLQLGQAARGWRDARRDRSGLYRGARLTAAVDWAAEHDGDLNVLEREFVAASREEANAEATRARKVNRRLRALLTGVAALLVLALAAGGVAMEQRSQARDSATRAENAATTALAHGLAGRSAAEPVLYRAVTLAQQGLRLRDDLATRDAMLTTLMRAQHVIRTYRIAAPNHVLHVSLSPDDSLLAASDNNAHAVVFDVATGRLVSRPSTSWDVAFAPDGSLLRSYAVKGRPAGLQLLDPRTGAVRRSMQIVPARLMRGLQDPGQLPPLAFAPDGERVAMWYPHAGANDPPGRLVQIAYPSGGQVGASIRLGSNRDPAEWPFLAYTRNGKRLVMVEGNVVRLFDAASGRGLHRFDLESVDANGPGPDAEALSPDGRLLGYGDIDGSVHFLDLRTGRTETARGSHAAPVDSVRFTPDGATLATSSIADGTFLWDVMTRQIRQHLGGSLHSVDRTMAVSSDGTTLFAGSYQSTVTAYDLVGSRSVVPSFVAAETDGSQDAWTLAVSPDSRLLAVGSTSGDVHVWSVRSRRQVAAFHALPGLVSAVSFASDTSLVVAGMSPAAPQAWVRLFRLGDQPRLVRSMRPALDQIYWATVSPDGRRVAAVGLLPEQAKRESSVRGAVTEWNLATGRLAARPVVTDHRRSDVAYSPDGRMLVASGSGETVDLIDPRAGRVVKHRSVPGADFDVAAVAFSPDGRRFVTGDFSGFLRMFSADGRRKGRAIQVSDSRSVVNWSPDGRTLVTGGWSGEVGLIDVRTHQQIGSTLDATSWMPAPDGGGGAFPYAVFTPDSRYVVVANDSGRVWLLPVSARLWRQAACRVTGGNIPEQEWRALVPELPYRRLCTSMPPSR